MDMRELVWWAGHMDKLDAATKAHFDEMVDIFEAYQPLLQFKGTLKEALVYASLVSAFAKESAAFMLIQSEKACGIHVRQNCTFENSLETAVGHGGYFWFWDSHKDSETTSRGATVPYRILADRTC